MIEIVDFKAEHLDFMRETGLVDIKLKPWLLPEHSQAIEQFGGAYSVLDDKKPVACGGIIQYWKNRGEAWLIFGKPTTESFVVIFKMVQRFISISPLRRIEMVIDCDFPQGHRWAGLLGFEKEAEKLKAYRQDGSDVSLYALIRSVN